MKKEVGYDWTIPEDILFNCEQFATVGGYIFIKTKDTNELLIQGSSTFNLSSASIKDVSYLPVTKQVYESVMVNTNNVPSEKFIENIFDLQEDKVYVQVSYGGKAWIFEDLWVAHEFGSLIIQFKIHGLQESLKKDNE